MDGKHTILIVDDDKDVRSITRMTLESENFRVLAADDGLSGLELARRHKPDLILLDILMPGVNGFEVFEELRKDESTRDIPVVMLTVLSEREQTKSIHERGVKYYMVKPFEYDELIAQVRTALEDAKKAPPQDPLPPDTIPGCEPDSDRPGADV